MPEKRHIAVIGLGTFGSAIACELSRMGDSVMGIDTDEGVVNALDGEVDIVVQADATDPKVLDHAGIESYDAVIIAIGDDMQASLLTAMQVMKTGCKALYVKAKTPEHGLILKAMGVRNLIEPEQSFALHMAQRLHNPQINDFLNLGNGNYVASMRAPSATNCKTINDIDLARFDLSCIAIDIGERILTHDLSAHDLSVDDKLILAGKRSDLRRFALNG